MHRPTSITLLDVPVHDVTLDETISLIADFISSQQPHHLVTVNPEFIMAAQHNADFRAVLQHADLAVPDGAGLRIGARLSGQRLAGRVPGVELVERIAAAGASHGWRLYLLGAAPGIAEAAAAAIRRAHPGVEIAGCFAGSPHRVDEPGIRQRITAARPDVLLVAYGAPAQDLWIARNQPHLRVPVAIGVGGTFDYVSGRVMRAPRWMRRLGLEWLFRLLRQPWRWRRIWTAVVRFPLAVWRAQF